MLWSVLASSDIKGRRNFQAQVEKILFFNDTVYYLQAQVRRGTSAPAHEGE
jgi:hypothetical protein